MALNRIAMPSPNFSSRNSGVRLIVVHTAEGSTTIESLGSFFSNPSSEVSSHTGIDDKVNTCATYVDRTWSAWTQASANPYSIATELCAFAEWDRATWLQHPNMLDNCRQWIVEESQAFGIPLIRLGASDVSAGKSGVCGHNELGASGGGHWDPGPSFPWDIVLSPPAPIPPPVPPGLNAAVVGITSYEDGYVMVGADGGVFNYGCDFKGSAGAERLAAPVVGIDGAADGSGYWLTAADGGVFNYGARFYGSKGGERLNAPVVGIAGSKTGKGYWLAAADGGVFSYGDAQFHGSAGGERLNAPVVGISRSGDGYVLCASDGGVFNYGCDFHGSAGDVALNQPITGIDALVDGSGYRLVAADGGIFCYDAPYVSSMGGEKLNWPACGLASSPRGSGYWISAQDGGVFAFGAPFLGSVQS